MRSDTDLKELWNRQEATIPETKDFFEHAKKFRRQTLMKLVLMNVLLIATSVFIIFVWYYSQPFMIITKVGTVLVIAAMAIYLFVYNRLIPSLIKVGFEVSSKEYLEQLLKLKEKQRFLQTTMMNVYFILLTSGLCMYMYEFALRMSLLRAVLTYALSLAWFGFNWFYTRPRSIRKQQAKINELISRCSSMQEQLGGDAENQPDNSVHEDLP